jgi:LmbE family N-acetylglucosaminyl deacetylase
VSVGISFTGLRSVLCLGAHPDDIEIGCGATLLWLLNQNPELEVCWAVLSASEERLSEAHASPDTLLDVASRLDVRIAGFRDTFFPHLGNELKEYMVRLGSEIRPDLVFTHWGGDLHQDHRMVNELTWQTFRNQLILEYEVPKWDGDMGRPNLYVHLERQICERKVEHLLQAFPTQAGRDWFDSEVFWGLLRLRGMEARSPSGYAEAFHCRKLVLG